MNFFTFDVGARSLLTLTLLTSLAFGCGDDDSTTLDASLPDTSVPDAAEDSGDVDAGEEDAGEGDAALEDGGAEDAPADVAPDAPVLPLTLESVSVNEAGNPVLRFDNPIPLLDGVDPSQFRISFTMSSSAEGGATEMQEVGPYECTASEVEDLADNAGMARENAGMFAETCGFFGGAPAPAQIMGLTPDGADGIVLVLSPPLSPDLTPSLCTPSLRDRACAGLRAVTEDADLECDIGIAVHYAPAASGALPGLDPISPDFVSHEGEEPLEVTGFAELGNRRVVCEEPPAAG